MDCLTRRTTRPKLTVHNIQAAGTFARQPNYYIKYS